MLIWYKIFSSKRSRGFLSLLGVLVAACISLSIPAEVCNTSPVFAFSRALYYEEYGEAREWLSEIERRRNPQTSSFLGQVLLFKRAYDDNDAESQKHALEEIEALLASLSGSAGMNGEPGLLAQANMLIHASRLHLAVGNLVRATKRANEGKALLDQVLELDPDNPNTLLANGLYQYYTGSEDEAFNWMLKMFFPEGNQGRGLELIEQAVVRSPDHAFEAARTLISDVSWNRQSTCRYVPLLASQAPAIPRSIPHRQLMIAARLFCGQPQLALEAVERTRIYLGEAHIQLHGEQDDWLFAAELHARAALGDNDGLEQIRVSKGDQGPVRRNQLNFAMARALDIRGQHQQAATLYRQVLASDLNVSYQKLAKIHLKIPFVAPVPFDVKTNRPLQFACGGGP